MNETKSNTCVGGIVQSLAGHDKNRYYLVLSVDENYVNIADGRKRKVSSPKRKKTKHIKNVSSVDEQFIEHILNGKPIGNERVAKAIKNATIKQED